LFVFCFVEEEEEEEDENSNSNNSCGEEDEEAEEEEEEDAWSLNVDCLGAGFCEVPLLLLVVAIGWLNHLLSLACCTKAVL